MLRHAVSFEEVILFLKDPETAQTTCVSKEGRFEVSDLFPDRQNAIQQITSQSCITPGPFLGNCHELQLRAPQCGKASPPKLNEYLPLQLQGLHTASGILGFYFKDRCYRDDKNTTIFQKLASVIGSSIENVILRERFAELQSSLNSSRSHISNLRAISLASTTRLNLQSLIDEISVDVRKTFGTEILCLLRYRPDDQDMMWSAMHFPNGLGPKVVGTTTPILHTRNGGTVAIKTRRSYLADRRTLEQTADENCIATLLSLGAQTYYAVPLIYGGEIVGVLSPAHIRTTQFTPEEIGLWEDCAGQVSVAIKCLLTQEENSQDKTQYAKELLPMRYEVQSHNVFSNIVGESAALKRVFSQVELVAHTDSSVLIVGETGTGKGMLAQVLHGLSGRKDKPFIQVNCASIPAPLLESEMFGHEKGAFTGATSKRVGCFERANGGTLFLDEIGEMPMELQPKLLRAVQEQRFERLGGSSSIQVDVRFIWATNRDLKRMVTEKQFRSDLYYRLNVFPIVVPPLRERVEDIPLLVHHFVREFCASMGKSIDRVPAATMDQLMRREWPGNVRELRNVVERAAILSSGRVLELPLDDLTEDNKGFWNAPSWESSQLPMTAGLANFEREYIMQVLRETGGVVAWAASRLQLKRTTLDSRLRRLGISEVELQSMRRERHRATRSTIDSV
jgi:formate hydrogenlyase transcriptional activator